MPALANDILRQAPPAATPLPLRTNFAWTLAGNVVYAGCQWGMLVALAKLGTPEKVGQFALGLAVTAPVVMFSQLQLRAVQATDAKREYQFGDYLALRLLTTALALLVIAGIVAAAGYSRETALVVLIVGGIKAVDSLSDVYYGLWQQHERMDGIARAMIVNGVVSVAALAALMAATRNIVLATLGSALGSLAAWLYTLARNRRLALATGPAARPRWHPPTLKRLTWLAMPLGVATLLMSLNANMPRYFIEHYRGAGELGIFAAISYLMVAGTTVVGALGQSTTPRLARFFAGGELRAFRGMVLKTVMVGLVLGTLGIAIAVFAGRPVLTMLYRPEYAEYTPVFVWAMVAAGLLYVAGFLSYALTAARGFISQLAVYAVTAVCVAVSSAILVPRDGALGAAWAISAGGSVQIASALVALRLAASRESSTERP